MHEKYTEESVAYQRDSCVLSVDIIGLHSMVITCDAGRPKEIWPEVYYR